MLDFNEEHLTKVEMMEEEFFLGLRKKSGVSIKRFEEKFGYVIRGYLWRHCEKTTGRWALGQGSRGGSYDETRTLFG